MNGNVTTEEVAKNEWEREEMGSGVEGSGKGGGGGEGEWGGGTLSFPGALNPLSYTLGGTPT